MDKVHAWPWGMMILPYVDQAPLFNQIDPGNSSITVPTADLATATDFTTAQTQGSVEDLCTTTIPVYLCPSAPGERVNKYQHKMGTLMYAMTSRFAIYPNGGAPYCVRISDVLDGTSNTILMGEKALMEGPFLSIGATWASHRPAGSRIGIVHHASAMNTPFDGPWDSANNQYIENTPLDVTRAVISSAHPGGAHILLADGSVRFLSENIEDDPSLSLTGNFVYSNLFMTNDGNPIGEF